MHSVFEAGSIRCADLTSPAISKYVESDQTLLRLTYSVNDRIFQMQKCFIKIAILPGLRSWSRIRSESEVLGRSWSRTVKRTRSQTQNILSNSDSSCPISLHTSDVNRATYAAACASRVQCSNLFRRTLPRIARHSVRLIKSLHLNL